MKSTSVVTHPVRYDRFTHEDGRLVHAEGKLRLFRIGVPRELAAILGDEIHLTHDGVTLFVRLEAPAVESCPAGCPSSIHLDEERETLHPPNPEHTPPQSWPRAAIDWLYGLHFQIREGRR
jgi:hypothetical protein